MEPGFREENKRGFMDLDQIQEMYLFLDIPSTFHVNIFRLRLSSFAPDSGTDGRIQFKDEDIVDMGTPGDRKLSRSVPVHQGKTVG